jgi:molybdenum-dependent DNA-binding transcriptional regulator ModE
LVSQAKSLSPPERVQLYMQVGGGGSIPQAAATAPMEHHFWQIMIMMMMMMMTMTTMMMTLTVGLDGLQAKSLAPPERVQLYMQVGGGGSIPQAAATAPMEHHFWQADHTLPVAEGKQQPITPFHPRLHPSFRSRLLTTVTLPTPSITHST